MKSERLAFGLFILTAGVSWLAVSLGWVPDGWSVILPYWPVVLILWGIAIMVRQPAWRAVALSAAAIFLAIWFISWFDPVDEATVSDPQTLTVSEAGVTTAFVRFDSGAGQFNITDSNTEVLAVNYQTTGGNYMLEQTVKDSNLRARVWYDQNWGRPRIGMMRGWHNEATLSLGVDPVWEIESNTGASEMTIDASDLKLEKAVVSAGAAEIEVTLGNRLNRAELIVKAGASDIRVNLPEGVGVRAEMETGLTGQKMADLKKVGERVWESDGYSQSEKQINLRFETGVSDIELTRY